MALQSPSCAQPSEKEIFDFVFEHGWAQVEILDFVTERVKRCIAAKRMNLECAKKFGSIFYGHSVFNFSQFINAVICEDILMRNG